MSLILTEESTSKYIQLENMKLHYNEAGQGEAVIMLHGGGAGAGGWSNYSKNIGHLVEKGFRVILLDCPGFNKSDPIVTSTPRRIVHAQAVKDLMDALDIQKAHLVGNSLGGMSAVSFALDFPERLDKLVIMGSGAFMGPSLFNPMPREGTRQLLHTYENPSFENLKKLLELLVYDHSSLTDELIQERYENMMRNDGEHLRNFVTSKKISPPDGLFTDVSDRLKNLQAPTLAIWGRDDRFASLDHALKLIWLLPNARLHIFSRCGHWAQWEQPEEFNRLVSDFLTN